MLMFGLRLGPDPRVVVTTTPKPIKIIRELIADPTTVITRGPCRPATVFDFRRHLARGRAHALTEGKCWRELRP